MEVALRTVALVINGLRYSTPTRLLEPVLGECRPGSRDNVGGGSSATMAGISSWAKYLQPATLSRVLPDQWLSPAVDRFWGPRLVQRA